MPALWFLAGLGVIMVIVGINTVYDHMKEKQAKEDPEPLMENDNEAGLSQSAFESGSESRQADAAVSDTTLRLSSVIEQKLAAGQAIFGLPMRACEKMGQDTLIAMDREDNIYVIETALRKGSADMYDQVMSDLAFNQKRIQGSDRKAYAIVCSNAPSPLLVAAAEKNPAIRIFAFDISFRSIY